MKKFGRALLMLICVTGLVVIFSAGCLQNLSIPTHIDERAIDYSEVSPTSYLPWTTLWDAQRIRKEILYKHGRLQVVYKRLQEDDTAKVTHIIGGLDTNIGEAQTMKEKLFNPNGSVGMAMTALFGGTIGAFFINTPKKKKA